MEYEEVRDRVAQRLREAIEAEVGTVPDLRITREELYALEEASRRKRRNRALRRVGTAAAIILISGIIVTIAFTSFFEPVDADKNKKKVEKHVNQYDIVIDGEDGNATVGSKEVNVTTWPGVEDYKKSAPDLYVPSYVPDGYEFVTLDVLIEQETTYTYSYRSGRNGLTIVQQGTSGNYNVIVSGDDLTDAEKNKIIEGLRR